MEERGTGQREEQQSAVQVKLHAPPTFPQQGGDKV
jgi:hypothetical protein